MLLFAVHMNRIITNLTCYTQLNCKKAEDFLRNMFQNGVILPLVQGTERDVWFAYMMQPANDRA